MNVKSDAEKRSKSLEQRVDTMALQLNQNLEILMTKPTLNPYKQKIIIRCTNTNTVYVFALHTKSFMTRARHPVKNLNRKNTTLSRPKQNNPNLIEYFNIVND